MSNDINKASDKAPALEDKVIDFKTRAQKRQEARGEAVDQQREFRKACTIVQKAKIPLMTVAIINGEAQVYSSVDSENSDDFVDLFKHMLDEFKNSNPPEDQGESSIIWTPGQK